MPHAMYDSSSYLDVLNRLRMTLYQGITSMENASDETAPSKTVSPGKPVEKPAASKTASSDKATEKPASSKDSKPASSNKAEEKPPASKLPMNLAKKNAVEANKKQWGIEEPLKP